nr:transposase [Sphingomonas montana]
MADASNLIMDGSPVYNRIGREFGAYTTVNRGAGDYIAHKTLHANTVESCFSIFKRGAIGANLYISEAHLGGYCADFDMRYNTRYLNDTERAAMILKGGEGRRLTYRRIGNVAA